MYALSKFSFISNFNKEKFTKQEAYNNGLSNIVIAKCDKNNDGNISIEEILENSDACDKIVAKINADISNIVNSIKALKGEKTDVEKDEKAMEKEPKKPDGFKSFLKQPPKFGDFNKFNIAA